MCKRLTGLSATPRNELLVIDASIYLHRAYYASSGAPGGMVRGFAELLAELLDTRPPTFGAVAFDSGKPSFRADEFPSYKAHRKPHPPGFDEQVPLAQRVARAFGFAVLVADRVEGDDLIAGAVELATRQAIDVTILSIDKDLAQLVQRAGLMNEPGCPPWFEPEVVMLDRPGGTELDEFAVFDKYGVLPQQIPDWIGLAGDSSDGLPGVEGIGALTAASALGYGDTIEGLLELTAAELRALLGQSKARNFQRDLGQAILCRRLAQLRPNDLKGVSNVEAFRRLPVDSDALYVLSAELGFDDWTRAISSRAGNVPRAILAAQRGALPSSPTRAKPEDHHVAKPTAVKDRLAARKVAIDAKRRRGKRGKSKPEKKSNGETESITADDLLVELLELDPDYDIDDIMGDTEALADAIEELRNGATPTPIDLDDADSVIAGICALNPKRTPEKLKPLSLKVLRRLLKVAQAVDKGDGAKGVNPPPAKAKKTTKRTPPLPDEYGGKTVSRAAVADLRTYVRKELDLVANDAQRDALRPLVEAHLRGDDLPEHELETIGVPNDSDDEPGGEGPIVYVPGLVDDDGDSVEIRDATDTELAEAIAHRTVKGDSDDYVDLDRDDLEYLALETFAAHAHYLEAAANQPTDAEGVRAVEIVDQVADRIISKLIERLSG